MMPPIVEEKPVDTSSFVREMGGYYQGSKGGKPQSQQELDYILSYMQERGHAPTPKEVAGYMSGISPERDYLEGSLMREMGFENWQQVLAARKVGETYGPYAGAEVPEGSLVVTDPQGNPYIRYMGAERVPGHYLEKGQFVMPPGMQTIAPPGEGMKGYMAQTQPFDIRGEQVYPSYEAQRMPFERPQMEEALGRYAPEQVYQARLSDYLTRQIEKDAPQIKQITEQYNAAVQELRDRTSLGEIETEEYNANAIALRKNMEAQMANLMTDDKAMELAQQAIGQFGQAPVEQLPLYADLQGVEGEAVMNLYNRSLGEFQKQYQTQLEKVPQWGGYPSTDQRPTGKEQAEFLDYVSRAGFAPEYQKWAGNQFWDIYNTWIERLKFDPSIKFMDFARQYIETGGLV
uniref:Uncharacterized protein n=1 Tax=viral metagenome TaxID=1070528 RepID=A0A6M3K4B2_9ZZZZ